MQWKTDWGLRARMVLTMFLLFALYIVFVGVIFRTGYWVMLPLMGIFLFAQFFFSDKLALRSMGAKTVDESGVSGASPDGRTALPAGRPAQAEDRRRRLARAQRLRDGPVEKSSAVAVTTGIMDTLDQDELEGVIAHELAHIKNRDVMVMTIASFLSTIAFMVVRWGAFFGGGSRRQGGGGVIVAILASLVVWIISFLLIRALSRYREFAADRGGRPSLASPPRWPRP